MTGDVISEMSSDEELLLLSRDSTKRYHWLQHYGLMNIFEHVWKPAIIACNDCSALHAINCTCKRFLKPTPLQSGLIWSRLEACLGGPQVKGRTVWQWSEGPLWQILAPTFCGTLRAALFDRSLTDANVGNWTPLVKLQIFFVFAALMWCSVSI